MMQHQLNSKDEDLQCCHHHHSAVLYASECCTLLATNMAKLEVFQMSSLCRILGVTRCDQLRNEVICQWCMEQPTVGKQVRWNHQWWFGQVCWMDNAHLLKQLLLAESQDGWCCHRMHQRNNVRIRLLLMHQLTSWSINRVRTSLDKHRSDLILTACVYLFVDITVNCGCVSSFCCLLNLLEIIVFEGPNVKVLLKASQMLVIRNFIQAVKHGSLFMQWMPVCRMQLYRIVSWVESKG